ncbi:hypothetical protein N0V88_003689 [Collariella sp. IMI 366227]|nr:hypothetical protein N0V88_003689 [Collariella sp. IMI 366227]
MSPSTLDLFILTFNCAKNLINPSVFSAHLHGALSSNATGLPDVIVFSLQEVAPLSYAFIGNYFLAPYYARFVEALNLAAAQLLETAAGTEDGYTSFPALQVVGEPQARKAPYTLVRAKNVGMTAILLFARDPASIHKIEEAECGFGAADMGNKGAVGLRVTYSGGLPVGGEPPRTTTLTFVAAHLAAMEWNLKKRNANWRAIVAGLTFANPRDVLPGIFLHLRPQPQTSPAQATPSPPSHRRQPRPQRRRRRPRFRYPPLLTSSTSSRFPSARHPGHPPLPFHLLPTAHLFIAGDLNYRIASTTPPPHSPFPSLDPSSRTTTRPSSRAISSRVSGFGQALHGLSEAKIQFAPTYKFEVVPEGDVTGR